MRNKVDLIKIIGTGYEKMHDFHGNPVYDSQKWG